MSPGAGRPRSTRAHNAILDAAIALTREVGYDALSIEAVAARAGVGKATIYRRWESKELLITEAVGRITRRIPEPQTGSLERDVVTLMRAAMAMYRDPATGALLSGLVAAMARSVHVAAAVRSHMVEPWRERLRRVLRSASSRGELRSGRDIEVALDLLSGALFYRYLMLGVAIDESFTRSVVRTVLRGLAADSRGARAKR